MLGSGTQLTVEPARAAEARAIPTDREEVAPLEAEAALPVVELEVVAEEELPLCRSCVIV